MKLRFLSLSVILMLLVTSTSFAQLQTSKEITSSGTIDLPSKTYNLRGACVTLCLFHPSTGNYVPNAWDIIKELGITHLRIQGGQYGDVWRINMKNNPNSWAQNLMSFLNTVPNDVKIAFHEMGTPWHHLLGISYGETPSISEAKGMIDQLAGNNALGHNFITDPRIWAWTPANEPDIANRDYLNWIIQICDYIRSKGGKVFVASPRTDVNGDGVGEWYNGEDFHVIEPILRGHVDYLDRHLYEVDMFASYNYDYSKFYNYYKSVLQSQMIDGRGTFPVENLILGEFGIWRGYRSDCGYTGSFTDEQRAIYYQAVLDACRNVGIKNVFQHTLFEVNVPGENPATETYGIVTLDGKYLAPAPILKTAYTG